MTPSAGIIAGARLRNVTRATWDNPPPITVAQARNRATQVVSNSTFTDGYDNATPAANTNFDFTGSGFESIGYCDFDSRYNTGRCVTQCGTPHGMEDKPIRIASAATAGVATTILGGKSRADQPLTLTWGEMKHGRTVQDDWDTGGTSGSNPTNDVGAFVLGVQNGSYIYLDGVRVYNTMDGIRVNNGDTGSVASHGICYFKNAYIERANDTALAAEGGHLLRGFDFLVKNSYGFVDCRNNPSDMSSLSHIFEYGLIRLQRLPGGFRYPRSATSHNKIYKSDALSPKLNMKSCTIALEDTDENPNFPASGTYTNVRVLWLRNVPCPWTAEIRSGMTLVNADGTQLTAALDEWNSKESAWMTRHNLTSYAVGSANDMIDALGPPV